MEIKRLGENKIRCALTEEEIRDMGFDIEEIIGNGDTTQQFMRLVLNLVEEQEHISLENISPMVKAELLSDHSMAITFGGDSDMSFKDLMEAVNQLMNQMTSEKIGEFKDMSREERQNILDAFFEQKKADGKEGKKGGDAQNQAQEGRKACAVIFRSLDQAARMCRNCFRERIPASWLYFHENRYYLVLDFSGFEKEEIRMFACLAVEYEDGHISNGKQVAYIIEHGQSIVKKEAVQTLMAL